MKSLKSKSRMVLALVAAALAVVVVAHPVMARDNPADHPIKILKARYQNDQSRGGSMSARGNLTVWMQNAAELTVDGIEVEVELYNDRNRLVETLRKEIEPLEGGAKKVITFRWDVLAERSVKPRFFVSYNARGTQKARFEGETPNWN